MQLTLPYQELVKDQNSRHPRQENRPSRKHGNEGRNQINQITRTDGDGDDSQDETTTSDVYPARTKSCHIHACRNGVENDAECHLRSEECEAGEERTGSGCGGEGDGLNV